MTPTAKQARVTLAGGRKYVKPTLPSVSIGIGRLATWLVQENPESATAGRLSASLRIEGKGRGAEAAIPVEALEILEDSVARELLVATARRTQKVAPDVAYSAAFALRVYASAAIAAP